MIHLNLTSEEYDLIYGLLENVYKLYKKQLKNKKNIEMIFIEDLMEKMGESKNEIEK